MSRAGCERKDAQAGAVYATAMRSVQDYFWRSGLPLTTLVFIMPMLVLYEVGTRLFASDVMTNTETRVLAFTLTRRFMELFGATGHYLPGLAVFGILLAWHIARRDAWELQVGTAMVMVFESVLMAFPLLAIARLLGYYLPLYAIDANWRAGVVLALGAGVYEELVFRLAAFTLLNMLLIDLLRIDKRPAYILMVAISSVLFAAYHYWSPQSSPFRWSEFIFRTASGVYFGVLFMSRGFGITAGAHAAYDIYYFAARAMLIG